ncbi:hypothetical protein KVV02_007474 [Mortierella alpina]|uniref:Conserved oligomeric Golgi complex subunit 5 n=1 Tax=Mortierella alpina TaxID=64518 RepID=A0A9P8A4Q0_MORAP|nr:hypothetical protein KVV02_007474 [Mortierella alpina]
MQGNGLDLIPKRMCGRGVWLINGCLTDSRFRKKKKKKKGAGQASRRNVQWLFAWLLRWVARTTTRALLRRHHHPSSCHQPVIHREDSDAGSKHTSTHEHTRAFSRYTATTRPMAATIPNLDSYTDYDSFLVDHFDPNAHANSIIHQSTKGDLDIATSLSSLSFSIDSLNKQLHDQVTTHYNDLLSQAAGIRELETVLETVKFGLKTLSNSMGRLSLKIKTPSEQIQTYTTQLQHLQATSEMLRRVLRFLYLSKRLEMQMPGGELELTQAALTLSEVGTLLRNNSNLMLLSVQPPLFEATRSIRPSSNTNASVPPDTLLQESDLEGIYVVDQEVQSLECVRGRIVDSADRMLQDGMDSQNQAQVGSALQVFYSLKRLDLKIVAMTSYLSNKLHSQIKLALDIQSIQKEAKGD